MSIPEAARLVLKAGVLNNGDLFILEMGAPIRIVDLANRMISLSGYSNDEVKIKYTGLREGEKLYEELLTKSEEIVETGYDRLLVSKAVQEKMSEEELEKMMSDFKNICETYNSRIIKDELKKWVLEYKETLCQS